VTLLEAIILGIVQGATEFLPVSSSAHLRIVPALAGWADPGPAFTAVIQCGTLVAILGYFRADVLRIATAWVRELLARTYWRSLDARMGWLIVIGTIPIIAGGLILKPLIETEFRSLYVIAGMLIAVGLLMLVAEWFAWWRAKTVRQRDMQQVDFGDAVAIGLAQVLALVPGTSRSGITIVAGLFRGLTREAAARFSFLLSLPAVFAAAAHQLYHERDGLLKATEGPVNLLVATVVAGVVGYLSIALLLAYVRQHATTVFVVYRLILAGLLIALLTSGRLDPLTGLGKDEGGTMKDENGNLVRSL
jgi:undecaprenyl-diphosphatase